MMRTKTTQQAINSALAEPFFFSKNSEKQIIIVDNVWKCPTYIIFIIKLILILK